MPHNLTSHAEQTQTCAPGFVWDPVKGRCVPIDTDTARGGSGKSEDCPPGFVFDRNTRKCVPAQSRDDRPPPKQEQPTQDRILRNPQGEVTGIELSDGRTFFGLDRGEVGQIVENRRQKREIPEGAIGATEAAEAEGEQERVLAIAQQIGKNLAAQGIEVDPVSLEQAIKSGLASAGAGVVGGAIAGTLAGAPAAGVGAVPGAIGGAVLGGVGAGIAGFRSNLKTQRADMLKGEASNLLKSEQNMLKIVMNTNQGGDPIVNLRLFNDQLSLINENEARLKLETTDDLSRWLGEDGHRQQEKYETFNSAGGMKEILIELMGQAILNPDPNKNLNTLQRTIDEDTL